MGLGKVFHGVDVMENAVDVAIVSRDDAFQVSSDVWVLYRMGKKKVDFRGVKYRNRLLTNIIVFVYRLCHVSLNFGDRWKLVGLENFRMSSTCLFLQIVKFDRSHL